MIRESLFTESFGRVQGFKSLRVLGSYVFKFLSFYLLLVELIGVTNLAIAEGPDTLWTKTYGGISLDESESVQECAEGRFIIAGWTESFSADSSDVYLIRTDSDGDTLWTQTYGGTDDDYGSSVQECAGGGFIIAGRTGSFGASDEDVYLIRISEVGVEERNERLEIGDWRLQIYPNPSLGKAVIKLSSHQAIKEASIKIHDLSGKLVKYVLTTNHDVEMNLEELSKGIYFVRVEVGDYKATKKLTILR